MILKCWTARRRRRRYSRCGIDFINDNNIRANWNETKVNYSKAKTGSVKLARQNVFFVVVN